MSKFKAAGLAAGIVCTSIAAFEVSAADGGNKTPIPDFTYIDRPWARVSLDFLPPASGLGPVTYDKVHPQYATGVN